MTPSNGGPPLASLSPKALVLSSQAAPMHAPFLRELSVEQQIAHVARFQSLLSHNPVPPRALKSTITQIRYGPVAGVAFRLDSSEGALVNRAMGGNCRLCVFEPAGEGLGLP